MRDDALAHDVRSIVAAQIHAFGVAPAVMDVISRKMETLRVSAVRAEAIVCHRELGGHLKSYQRAA